MDLSDSQEIRGFTCPICYDMYQASGPRIPFVLFCGHTLCGSCCCSLAQTSTSPFLNCPFCLIETEVTINFAIVGLLPGPFRGEKGGERAICGACSEREATRYCFECCLEIQYLCSKCSDLIHSFKKYESHSTKDIQQFWLSNQIHTLSLCSPMIKDNVLSLLSASGDDPASRLTHQLSAKQQQSYGNGKGKGGKISEIALKIITFLNSSSFIEAFLLARKNAFSDPDSAALLGLLIRDGHGTPVSFTDCITWGKMSLENGSELGRALDSYFRKDFKTAFPLFVPFAEAELSVGQRCLGRCLDIVPKDFVKGFECYLKSAMQGYSPSINNLASCFMNGEGVPKCEESGILFYEISAMQGNSEALKNLGHALMKPQLEEAEASKCFYNFVHAAALRLPSAINFLGDCYNSSSVVPIDDRLAVWFYRRGIELGESYSLCDLAHCYMEGYGLEKDFYRAFYYFLRGAEKDVAFGSLRVGEYYEKGIGGFWEINLDMAKRYYYRAARKGSKRAIEALQRLGEDYQPQEEQ